MGSNQSNNGLFSNSIPDNWSEISLLEADLEIEDGDRGKNYPKRSELTPVGYCPFLNNKNVIGDKINLDEVDFISKEKDNLLRKGRVRINDIVLTTRGSVGNVGLFTDEYPFKFARINSGMVIIRNNDKFFNLNFLYQLLKSPFMKSQYQSLSSGTAQPQLPIRDIKKLDLIVPPKDEQFRIAKLLDFLDSKIELNNRTNQTLEEMAQAIFKHWFVDYEFPNENVEPYKSSGGKFVESELGMIPEGWELRNLKELANFNNGKSIKANLRNEGGNNLIFGSNGIIGRTNEELLKEPCIIIGRVGAYCGSIQLSLEPCWVTDNAIICTPVKDKSFSFLYYLLLNSSLRDRAGGSAQPLLNQNTLKSIEILMPIQELVDQFDDIIKTFTKLKNQNKKTNNNLELLRDTLLPKLMSGEIRIPDAEQEVEACLQKSN